jgi:uncharacterized protein
MKTLSIPPLEIPLRAYATQANAILGLRGSGKSTGAGSLAEQMMDAGIPILVLDPIGIWRNLKMPGSGQGARGYPVVVAAVENGDLPLSVRAIPEIVKAALAARVSLVVDLFSANLSKSDWRKIVMQCCAILLHENHQYGLRHLFLEEAGEFVMQRIQPGQGECYSEVEKLTRMGGNKSIGVTLINPRAESVNKEVLELCDCVMMLRQKGRNSVANLEKWINFSDPESSKRIVQSMSKLTPGQCWVWPQDQDAATLCQFKLKTSFHPDRKNPQHVASGKPADVRQFVAELSQSLDKVLTEAKENDPAELKKRIKELERTISSQSSQTKTVEVRVPAFAPEEIKTIETARSEFWDLAARFDSANRRMNSVVNAIDRATEAVRNRPGLPPNRNSATTIKPDKPAGAPRTSQNNGQMRGGLRRMMIALAQRPGLNKSQLGVRAGLSSRSGTFGTYLGSLRGHGWIEGSGDDLRLTDAGFAALGKLDPLPEGKALYEYWLSELGNSGAARMLSALYAAHPRRLSKQELGEAADISHTSGTFGTYLGTLRRLELIEGRSELGVSAELF